MSSADKVLSMFGNDNEMSIGLGVGNRLGKNKPAFMDAGNRFGYSRFVRARR